ncbi:hypothetical protein KCP69_00950 [Salmonella enterica subsp. enterica]|nr:hypothetical protein KCP69_00950 [Salmonella enterica subsp. enterica]
MLEKIIGSARRQRALSGGKKRHGEKLTELNETSALPDGGVTPYPAYKLIISGTLHSRRPDKRSAIRLLPDDGLQRRSKVTTIPRCE